MRYALLAALLGLAAAPQQQPDLGIPVFPATNPWNWDISGFAVHPGSDAYIASIGAGAPIREDYAFPYSVVTDAQANVAVAFNLYDDESDPGPGFGSPAGGAAQGQYPFPAGAPIEGNGVGDAHCLVIDKDNALLYETYITSGGPPWTAACGAVFDLNSNAVRTEGWTSGDAAGLPIFPGLIRYEEVAAGAINHALRFTCSPTQNRHIYPARHHAGQANTSLPPMGLRVRLKATVSLAGMSPQAKVIAVALQRYGMILADNGSPWYVSGMSDPRFDDDVLHELDRFTGADLEAVNTTGFVNGP